ncbi:MAG: DUF4373 domain-containing protein [Synergistaceae bacterium]|nr:DUF4373 domain-containing protein [Synergistaceae bacterium]
MSRDIYKPYFSHDIYARQDAKIKNLLLYFRKESEDKAKAAYCVYWYIVEDMHKDDYKMSDLEAYADDYRCDVEFLKSILENFDLFRIENDCYISDRVLKNIQEQKEKHERAKQLANRRWQGKKSEENIVDSIIEIFNKELEKSQTVGKETKGKILKLTRENNISLETWAKVFKNAKRGWNIEGKNKKPSLKTILENWDSFASDDYYLAPDLRQQEEQRQALKAQQEQEQKNKAAEEKAYEEKKQAELNRVCDSVSAIVFLNRHYRLSPDILRISKLFQEFSKKYNITIDDVISARGGQVHDV